MRQPAPRVNSNPTSPPVVPIDPHRHLRRPLLAAIEGEGEDRSHPLASDHGRASGERSTGEPGNGGSHPRCRFACAPGTPGHPLSRAQPVSSWTLWETSNRRASHDHELRDATVAAEARERRTGVGPTPSTTPEPVGGPEWLLAAAYESRATQPRRHAAPAFRAGLIFTPAEHRQWCVGRRRDPRPDHEVGPAG